MTPEQRTRDRISEAFRVQQPTESERGLILTLYRNPNTTASILAEKMGYKDYRGWNARFGAMCKSRVRILGTPPKSEIRIDQPFYSGLISHYDKRTYCWRLRDDAVDAFRGLGIIQ